MDGLSQYQTSQECYICTIDEVTVIHHHLQSIVVEGVLNALVCHLFVIIDKMSLYAFCVLIGFSTYTVMQSVNNDSFIFCFLIFVPFFLACWHWLRVQYNVG